MVRIILGVILFIIMCTGVGIEASKFLNIKKPGFYTVIGFVVFFCLLQILYYPAQIFNLPFAYIRIVSLLLLGSGLIVTFTNYKDVIKEIFRKEMIIVLISVLIFSFIYSKMFLDIEFSDAATYLNYISQNINIKKLNMFNPVTGLKGHEWDIYYLYQGYYHFGSFVCWLINSPFYMFHVGGFVANITICTWTLGLIYSVISTMFIINLIEYFNFKNNLFKVAIYVYSLFFANFFYWKVAFSFYGNTYRALFGAILIFWIYVWLKEENEQIKYFFPVIITAGLSFTSSYLFISFVIMFSLAVYLFIIERQKVIYDMFTFVAPIAVYGTIMFGKVYLFILIPALLFLAVIYIGRLFKPVRRTMLYLDDFFYKHIKLIVFIILPIVLVLLTLYLNFIKTGFVPKIPHYFENHQNYDMVKDYYFVYSTIIDNFFNVIRWVGIGLIIYNAKSVEDKFLKVLIIITFYIFLNPLTFSAVAFGLTGIVYYRLIEVVFNPFIELLIFMHVFKLLDFNLNIKKVFAILILVCVLIGNVMSFNDSKLGLYTFYINGGKDTTPLEKISQNEIQAIAEMKKAIDNCESCKDKWQIVVISQTSALRTYMPEIYQIYTSRDNYYVESRLNEAFFQITRRHYPWLNEEVEPEYEDTCGYLTTSYGIDYILLEYWENPEFDKYSDACTVTNFTGSNYKVKTVIKEK